MRKAPRQLSDQSIFRRLLPRLCFDIDVVPVFVGHRVGAATTTNDTGTSLRNPRSTTGSYGTTNARRENEPLNSARLVRSPFSIPRDLCESAHRPEATAHRAPNASIFGRTC